jgi:23S rRNA pseudouridine2457 synthase
MLHHTFKLHKPFGMLSQLMSNDVHQSRKKRFLSELYHFPEGTMAVGRLDEKSEGLLLLTTDGKLSNTINQSGIEKEYWAQLDGLITDRAIDQLAKGVEIGIEGLKYNTRPCKVFRLNDEPDLPPAHITLRIGRHRPASWISITLTEGKFRQVRKMTASVGFPTLRLVRVRIGDIHLNNLAPGSVEKISMDLP